MFWCRDGVVRPRRSDVSSGPEGRHGRQPSGLLVAGGLARLLRRPAALVLLLDDPLLRGLKGAGGLRRNVGSVSLPGALAGPPDRFPLRKGEDEVADRVNKPALLQEQVEELPRRHVVAQ